MCFREYLALRFRGFIVLSQELLRPAFLATDRRDVAAVVDVHRKGDVVLHSQRDGLVVGERCMFDRVGPGQDRVLDRFGAMGMGGELDARGVCYLGDGLDFLAGHFRRARYAAECEYRAGSDDLEDVGAAIDSGLCLLPEVVGTASDAEPDVRWNIALRAPGDDQVATAAGIVR